jgi:hypothetical protein
MQTDVITLRGKEVPLTVESVDNDKLRFYAENPRIYSHLWRDGGGEPTQQEIFEVLSKTEHGLMGVLLSRYSLKGRSCLKGIAGWPRIDY